MGSSGWLDFLAVAVLGGVLGLCELLSRYRDEPIRAVWNLPAGIYTGINAGSAVIALWLMNVWHPDFGFKVPEQTAQIRVAWILASGLGAMAFFRSSIFVFRVGDQDVPLGPSLVMQVLLDVTDRAVDRGRAEPRGLFVSAVMKDIDFDKASLALPAYCFALMQNVSKEEQSAVGQQVNALLTSTMNSEIKVFLLGLVLLNIVGEAVLKAAVSTLQPYLTGAAPSPPPPPAAQQNAPPQNQQQQPPSPAQPPPDPDEPDEPNEPEH
jgi:hypothetical protein